MNSRVDKLGRIVIPIKMRKKYNLTEGVQVEFSEINGALSVSVAAELCKLCNGVIEENRDIPICIKCAEMIRQKL